MMLSLESLAYKADDAGGEFNAAQREVGCQPITKSYYLGTKLQIYFSISFYTGSAKSGTDR